MVPLSGVLASHWLHDITKQILLVNGDDQSAPITRPVRVFEWPMSFLVHSLDNFRNF